MLSDGFPVFRFYEAAIRGLTQSARSGRNDALSDSSPGPNWDMPLLYIGLELAHSRSVGYIRLNYSHVRKSSRYCKSKRKSLRFKDDSMAIFSRLSYDRGIASNRTWAQNAINCDVIGMRGGRWLWFQRRLHVWRLDFVSSGNAGFATSFRLPRESSSDGFQLFLNDF